MSRTLFELLHPLSASIRATSVAAFLGALASLGVCAALDAETRPVDLERSSMTVHVFKSGVLSAFGDNHEVRAPIASASVEDGAAPKVEITVDPRRMTVVDPDVSPEKRAEIQKRMHGPEVLDVDKFKEIRFHSTGIKAVATGRWHVEGVLSLRGKDVSLSFEVTEDKGRVRGSATVSQKAFGIQPISVAGGTVKVRDDVKIDFDIVAPAAAP